MLTIRKSGFKGIGNAYTGSSQALSKAWPAPLTGFMWDKLETK
jgi:hypothetical protein